MGEQYASKEWRLFIDASKTSLKAALIHIGNKKPSVPIAYSKILKENYDTMKLLLELVNYRDHNWLVCCDLKVVNILMGLQGGNVKYPCFICKFDRTAKVDHYRIMSWPLREACDTGFNVRNEPLVDRNRILIPPLHLKLGFATQLIKSLDGEPFEYLKKIFPGITEAKLTAGIMNGPDISKLLQNEEFKSKLSDAHLSAFDSLYEIIENFLGKKKSPRYPQFIERFLYNFHRIGAYDPKNSLFEVPS